MLIDLRNIYQPADVEATFARETIVLTNTGAGLFENQLARSVTAFNPITKKAYVNVADFTLNPFEILPLVFEAVEVGAASTSGAGSIVGLETELTGVSVSNPKAFVGLDQEQDPELRQACLDRLGSLSVRGPRSAYAWAVREAKLVDGVTPANVNRWRSSRYSSTGRVDLYVASPSGAPLAEVTEVEVARTLDVWVKRRPGVRAEDVKSTIEIAFAREGSTYPIGGIAKGGSGPGKLYSDWIAGVAKQAWPDVYDVDGTGADVTIAAGEVALLAITANVRLEDVE